MLNGGARTKSLPGNLDDVGVVWERRSGYETALARARLSMFVQLWTWSSSTKR